jgi:hypothetical protein
MLWPQASIVVVLSLAALLPGQAAVWGDKGHQIIALVAEQCSNLLRAEVGAMLGAGPDSLTAHDIANEATPAGAA